MGAPEATYPIQQIFADDSDAAERVLCEFIDRSNEWLEAAEKRVNERIDGAADVIDPDWVNNPNRQCKAPLAVHKDHDAVVTPLDTEDIQYDTTPLHAVDNALIEDATEWAEAFTADEHVSCIRSLTAELWPDYHEDTDSGASALRAWVEDERERERKIREQRKRDERKRRDRLDNFGEDVSITGQSITSSKGDIKQAAESIDVDEIIRQHAADQWNTASKGQKTMFNPSWRGSESGTSCYTTGNNTFYDTGKEAGGGPARAMAVGKGIISHPGQRLSGERWGMALDALRNEGYNIPVWIPERGSDRSDGGTYDQTPLWALRKAAVAVNVIPQDAFITRESDDGGTYQGFPGRQTYDQTLDELEALDIDHGRDRDGESANTMPSRVEAGLEKEPEDRDEQVVQLFKEMGRQQQQSE